MMPSQEEDALVGEGKKIIPIKQAIGMGAGTFGCAAMIDLVAHLGPTGLLVGGLAAYIAARHGPEVLDYLQSWVPPLAPGSEVPEEEPNEVPRHAAPRSWLDRTLGRFPGESSPRLIDARRNSPDVFLEETDDDGQEPPGEWLRPPSSPESFLFSEVLSSFSPDRTHIFLARTPEGQDLFCSASQLCHVALAGSTGGGKSSLMRLLLLQLCKAGMQVLLLNPHYTSYDIENDEDWTPFEASLAHPPLECRKYEVIEHFLKAAAKELIPKRLERRAKSLPVGKPYFIAIDELPSIVREIKAAPEYMRIILEEGRKVGVFLISAAQDFLVKTISPNGGGGSIRECYRTAYYVGGDPTTARVLLDMPATLIPEDELGKGVVMLRGGVASKKATKVLVPYVDNAALYRLLGPSTYNKQLRQGPLFTESDLPMPRGEVVCESSRESILEHILRVAETCDEQTLLQLIRQLPPVLPPVEREEEGMREEEDPPTLVARGLAAYQEGATTLVKLASALGISEWKARKLMVQIQEELKKA